MAEEEESKSLSIISIRRWKRQVFFFIYSYRRVNNFHFALISSDFCFQSFMLILKNFWEQNEKDDEEEEAEGKVHKITHENKKEETKLKIDNRLLIFNDRMKKRALTCKIP